MPNKKYTIELTEAELKKVLDSLEFFILNSEHAHAGLYLMNYRKLKNRIKELSKKESK